jgi:hypothetical protein
MKRLLMFVPLLLSLYAGAQELYVSTEPASNMPANSLGIRMTTKFFKEEHERVTGMRFEPELMWGVSKRLMIHLAGYASNQMQPSIEPEGGSIYAKYRFLSKDGVHTHFRMAAYVKGALINNPFYPEHYHNAEMDLEGGTSGITTGVIATQLIHKLAVSGTLGYNRYMNNTKDKLPADMSANAVNYSLSAGYLLLPRTYRSFEQTNLNLYVELLGKSNMDAYQYLDIAPAIQFIFNSVTRIDLGYRTQLFGNMPRNVFNTFMIRFEHNIFNVVKKKR